MLLVRDSNSQLRQSRISKSYRQRQTMITTAHTNNDGCDSSHNATLLVSTTTNSHGNCTSRKDAGHCSSTYYGICLKRLAMLSATIGLVVMTAVSKSSTLTTLESQSSTVMPKQNGHGINKDDKHAACWSDSLFYLSHQQDSPPWFFDIASTGHYVPSTRSEPRYDHISCFVMKSRYNCALPPQQSQTSGNYSTHNNRSIANANSTDAAASDYKLVLWPSANGMRKNMTNASSQGTISRNGDMDDSVCDLPAFMEDLGGPGGVASLILKQKRDSSSSTSSNNSNNERKKILTVVLHGSSYLRQVWESLTCSWKDHITDLLLYYQDLYLPNNSSFPNSSRIISFEKTEPKKGKYTANGAFIRGMTHAQGCHVFYPRPDMKDWFHPQVVLPPTIPGCSDDLAMVEFNHAIRFYFIMRQDYYQNLTHVYDELNLEPLDIDAMVFNMRNYSNIYPKD